VNTGCYSSGLTRIFQDELLISVQKIDGDEVFIIVNCGMWANHRWLWHV